MDFHVVVSTVASDSLTFAFAPDADISDPKAVIAFSRWGVLAPWQKLIMTYIREELFFQHVTLEKITNSLSHWMQ